MTTESFIPPFWSRPRRSAICRDQSVPTPCAYPGRSSQPENTMNIAVIGAGYVGLVTAAGLASLGNRVKVGEADPARLAELQAGGVPLHEAGLAEAVSYTH